MQPHTEPYNHVIEGGECKNSSPVRKLYHAPRFVVYGDFTRLTTRKGGHSGDGPGHPHSKMGS